MWREPRAAGAPLTYRPILDVARGVAAGYQTVAARRGTRAVDPAAVAEAALAASASLPVNTFVTIPVTTASLTEAPLRAVLARHGDLSGIVLDVQGATDNAGQRLDEALDACLQAGARIAVGGHDAAQPELRSIVRLRPAIIRLGRAWVDGIDTVEAKRSAIEVTGNLAGQLDAWILAESVRTAAELRVLASLGVPLAQGSFIGSPRQVWPEVAATARGALPPASTEPDGVLRALVQQAYTTSSAAAATAVLPDATGFDIVVAVDETARPVSVLEQDAAGQWDAHEALVVNVDTPVADAVARAMARPRPTRFSPLVCIDAAGRFVGILRIEHLMTHLATSRAG